MVKNIKNGEVPSLHSVSPFCLTHRCAGKVRVAALYGQTAQVQTSPAPVLQKYNKYSLGKPWPAQAAQLNGRRLNVLITADIWQDILSLFVRYLRGFELENATEFQQLYAECSGTD